MYKRSEYHIIKNRLEEQRRFIQVVMGARQIGKSTVGKNSDNYLIFNPQSSFIVGDGGIGVEDFFSMDVRKLF